MVSVPLKKSKVEEHRALFRSSVQRDDESINDSELESESENM